MLTEKKREKTKNLIVNLSRIGDILQTLRALKNYQLNYPETDLYFLGRKEFTTPLLFILKKFFKEIFFLDSISIDQLNKYQFNKVYNLTFSDFSSSYVSQIESHEKHGLCRDRQNNLIIPDSWSQYIFSNIMKGPYSPFSLVDIFKFILKNNEKSPQALRNLQSQKIAIHPFTSHDKKHWSVEKWTSLINSLVMAMPGIEIILLGGENDWPAGEELVRGIHPSYKENVKNAIGTMSLEETINKINRCRLFIGHDSMFGHLMALYKIQTVTISLGTVRASETTPYGEGNYNISPLTKCYPCFPDTPCSYYACHHDIKVDRVVDLLTQILKDGKDGKDGLKLESTKNITYTTFNNNLLRVVPLSQDLPLIKNIFLDYYFIIWSFLFEEKEINLPFLTETTYEKQLLEELEEYNLASKKLATLYQFAEKYTFDLLDCLKNETINKESIKEIQNQLNEIDQLSFSLCAKYEYLSPIGNFIFVALGNTQGTQISEIATKSILIYKEAVFLLQILSDLIEKTIQNFKYSQKGSKQSNQSSIKKEF